MGWLSPIFGPVGTSSVTPPFLYPWSGVTAWGFLEHPAATATASNVTAVRLTNFVHFMSIQLGYGEVHHRAHAGCELLSKTRGTSLNCLVGTSSKDKCLPPSGPLQKIRAREFGAHDGSSPSATS